MSLFDDELSPEDLKHIVRCQECGCHDNAGCPCEWVTEDRCSACVRLLGRAEMPKVKIGARLLLAPTGKPLLSIVIERVTKSQLVSYGGVRVRRSDGRQIGGQAWAGRMADRRRAGLPLQEHIPLLGPSITDAALRALSAHGIVNIQAANGISKAVLALLQRELLS